MTYHVYKADCYQASRVLMQSSWDIESIFIHRPRVVIKNYDQYLNFKNIVKLAVKNKKNSVIVFHAQSSLPYLIIFLLTTIIFRQNKFSITYDIHDLHENSKESDFIKVVRYEIGRYYILKLFEKIVFKVKSIKKITVSTGLSKIMASKYSADNPCVVRNIALTSGAKNIFGKHEHDKALLFFGTTERVPLELVPKIYEVGMELHLFGRGITENWLRGRVLDKYLDSVKVFGAYSPDKLEFLDHYNLLLIYAPNNLSLNFRYSLPNKLFQALERGVSVLVSKNFEEILALFEDVPGAVGILNEDDLLASIKVLLGARSPTYNEDIQRKISFLALNSKFLYLNAIEAA